MKGVTEQDEDYQTLLRESDECFGRLESLHLPEGTMRLIDRYVSGQYMKKEPIIVKSHDVHLDSEYIQWIHEIKERYRNTQIKAAVKVNSE